MKVDDEGVVDVGSDHCVLEMWMQMGHVGTEEVREARWKWKVDGWMEWEGYQGAVVREMEGLEEWIQVSGDSVEVVWEEWKRRLMVFPRDWCRSLVPLFKEGEVEDLNNYKGIALSSTAGNVFERVLDGRVREVVEGGVLKEAQGGFRSGRSCADQVFVLRNVLEMRRKQGLDSVVAFWKCGRHMIQCGGRVCGGR